MTQLEFNELMNEYISNLKTQPASSWSQDARLWAESKGIIAGDSNNNKMYKNFVSREEAAIFLYRLINHLENGNQKNSLLSAAEQELANLAQELRTLRQILNNVTNTHVDNAQLQEIAKSVNTSISALYAKLDGGYVVNLSSLIAQATNIQTYLTNIVNNNIAITQKTKDELNSFITSLKNTIPQLQHINDNLK